MYKTVWNVFYGDSLTKLTLYHFKKEPRFPSWYMQEGFYYEIDVLWNVKLIFTLKTFFKCLFHKCIIS